MLQVCTAKVLPWQDRLQTLVDQGEWHKALLLAMEFYRGTALVVVS